MSRYRSYVICTSPRSGSTLLCKMLQDAGAAGFPDSHFHAPSFEAWLGYYDLCESGFVTRRDALKAIFTAAFARGTAESDVFGLRMQRRSVDFFLEQLSVLHPSLSSDTARIEAAFGRTLFVHLTRVNKLDQAISHVKAEQSGLWHRAADGTDLERLSEPKDPIYDAAAIAAQLALAERMDRAWEDWFKVEHITPLRVTYDQLSAAPFATRDVILGALGVNFGASEDRTPPTAKLADATSRDWADRFRREQAG